MRSYSFSYPYLTIFSFFFFNDPATTEIYTLSLHDALPISRPPQPLRGSTSETASFGRFCHVTPDLGSEGDRLGRQDRKSTRLNSSHQIISYAVFCLKKKKKERHINTIKQ